MNRPKVATAILNWNGRHWLEKFLPSVMATDYANHQIVVIDNGSTDDTIDFLEKQYPEVQIVINSENHGFAGGYNEGLKNVEADYYAILNSDVEVDPNWLNPLVDLLEENEKIAACQPKLLGYNQKTHFEYAGACGGFIDWYGFPFCRGRIFESNEEDLGQYDTARPVFWATGAALFIRANLFHEQKGFDADFFAHMEEIDLCWRLQNAGYEIWAEPKSVCYHVGGGTLGKENPRKTYLNFRNNLYMMSKNLPLGDALIRILLRMIIDGQAAIKELFSGNTGFFKAILRAHFHFYLHSPKTFAKRKSIPVKRKFTSLPGVYSRSIVLWYYARRKRKFSDLPG
ncbi:MAG: glycosyltransferase family 2 protein [Bacteroidia bacterium]